MELLFDLGYEPRLKNLKIFLRAHGSTRHREFETLLLHSQGRCLIINLLLNIPVYLNEIVLGVLRERLNNKSRSPTLKKFQHDVYGANFMSFILTVYHESGLYQLFQQHNRLVKSHTVQKWFIILLFKRGVHRIEYVDFVIW